MLPRPFPELYPDTPEVDTLGGLGGLGGLGVFHEDVRILLTPLENLDNPPKACGMAGDVVSSKLKTRKQIFSFIVVIFELREYVCIPSTGTDIRPLSGDAL